MSFQQGSGAVAIFQGSMAARQRRIKRFQRELQERAEAGDKWAAKRLAEMDLRHQLANQNRGRGHIRPTKVKLKCLET